jgi:hypothetical protein
MPRDDVEDFSGGHRVNVQGISLTKREMEKWRMNTGLEALAGDVPLSPAEASSPVPIIIHSPSTADQKFLKF